MSSSSPRPISRVESRRHGEAAGRKVPRSQARSIEIPEHSDDVSVGTPRSAWGDGGTLVHPSITLVASPRHSSSTRGTTSPSSAPSTPTTSSPRPTVKFASVGGSEGLYFHKECLARCIQGRSSCTSCRRAIKALDDVGVCRLVVEAISMFSGDRTFELYGCRALASKAYNSRASKDHTRLAGGCEVLHRILSRPGIDVELQLEVLDMMTIMCVDCVENQRRLKEAGACESICATLEQAAGSVEVWTAGLQAAENIVWKSPENQAVLMEAGIGAIVKAAMDRFTESASLQTEACGLVADLCYRNTSSQASLAQLGLCEAVVRAVTTYPGERSLQLRVAQAVANLSHLNSDNQEKLGACGACAALCQGLADHDDLSLACEVSRAVDNLAWSHGTNQQRLHDAGACSLVCRILSAHVRVKAAVLQAARAVRALASGCQANQRALGASGACGLLIQAVRMHEGEKAVVCELANAIAAVINHDAANEEALMQDGAAQTIAQLMRHYPEDRDVHLRCVRILAVFSSSSCASATFAAHQDAFGREGICELLAQALHTHSEDKAMMVCCVRGVAGIACEHPANQERFGGASGCEGINNGLDLFVEDKDVQWYGAAAVANLSFTCPRNTERFGGRCCVLLCEALRRFTSAEHAHVALQIMRAMAVLAGSNSDNQDALSGAGACSLVCDAVKMHVADAMVVRYGARVIDLVASKSGAEGGACGIIADALEMFSQERDTAVECVRGLRTLLSLRSQHMQDASKEGLASLLCRILRTHMSDVSLVTPAMEAVVEVSQGCKAGHEVLHEAGAAELAVAAMRTHVEDLSVQGRCLRLLSILMDGTPGGQADVGESAASLVCDAMWRFPRERQITVHGLRVISTLAHFKRETSEKLVQIGVATLLAQTLRSQMQDAAVVTEACRAVRKLAKRSSLCQTALKEAGLCELVCRLGRGVDPCAVQATESSERSLLVQVCRAFSALSSGNEACQSRLVAAGALDVVVRVVTSCTAESDLGHVAVEAMAKLAIDNAFARSSLSTAQVVAWLLQWVEADRADSPKHVENALNALHSIIHSNPAAQNLSSELEVAVKLARLLSRLQSDAVDLRLACMQALGAVAAAHGVNQAVLAGYDVVPSIVALMQHQADSAEVQMHCLEAMMGLSALLHESSWVAQAQTAASDAVCRSIVRHASNSDVVSRACRCLLAMVPMTMPQQDHLAELGLPKKLTDALNLYLDHPGVVGPVLEVMAELIRDNAAVGEMAGASGACDAVVESLVRFGDDDGVGRYAMAAISSLVEACRGNVERCGVKGFTAISTFAASEAAHHEWVTTIGALCRMASLCASTDAQQAEAMAQGVVRVFRTALGRSNMEKTVLILVARLLGVMTAANDNMAVALVDAGVCGLIVDALPKMGDSSEGLAVVMALATRSATQQTWTALEQARAPTVLSSLLGKHNTNLELTELGMEVMATLARHSDALRVALGQTRALELTSAAMRTWPDDADVRRLGMQLLTSLAEECLVNQQRVIRLLCSGAINHDSATVLGILRSFIRLSDHNAGCSSVVQTLELVGMVFEESCGTTRDLYMEHEGPALFRFITEGISAQTSEQTVVIKSLVVAQKLLTAVTGASQDGLGEAGACDAVVHLLTDAGDGVDLNVELQELALRVLVCLAEDHDENHWRLEAAGACAAVIMLLDINILCQVYGANGVLSCGMAAWRAVLALATDDPTCQAHFMKNGVSQMACKGLLKSCPSSAEAKVLGMQIMGALCGQSGEAGTLQEAGVCDLICEAMLRFPEIVPLQIVGLSLLKELEVEVTSGSVACALAAALDTLGDQCSEVMIACDIAVQSVKARAVVATQALIGAGLHNCIVKASKRHADSKPLQLCVCHALGAMAHRPPSADRAAVYAVRRELAKAGAACVLVDIAERWRTDARVLSRALMALVNIAGSGADRVPQMSLQREHRLLPLLVSLLREPMDDRRIHLAALALMSSVCVEHAPTQDELGRHGACDVVAQEMWLHDSEMAMQMCRVVSVLAFNHPHNQTKLGEAGAGVMLTRLCLENACRRLVAEALHAAATLTFHRSDNQALLLTAKLHAAIIIVMKARIEDELVSVQCLGCLQNLLWKNAAMQRELASVGGCEAIVGVMRQHPGSAPIQEYGSANLAWLASVEANIPRLSEAGACPAICAAAECGPQALLQSLRAIGGLTATTIPVKVAHERLQQAGACELVVNILSTFLRKDNRDGDGSSLSAPAEAFAALTLWTLSNMSYYSSSRQRLINLRAYEHVLKLVEPSASALIQCYGWGAIAGVAGVSADQRTMLKSAGAVGEASATLLAERLKAGGGDRILRRRLAAIIRCLDPKSEMCGKAGDLAHADIDFQEVSFTDLTLSLPSPDRLSPTGAGPLERPLMFVQTIRTSEALTTSRLSP